MAPKHTVLLDPYAVEISPMLFLPATKDMSFRAIGAYIRLYLAWRVNFGLEALTNQALSTLGMEDAVVELLYHGLLTINDDTSYTLKPIPGIG